MKVAKNIWLINILCFLFTLNITAQTGKLFNTENQLSSSFANQVFQARNGFIWIATRNGINVYDGYNFTLLRRDFEDNRGLSNNYINCIDEDHEGNILLGTSNSLIEYNGRGFQVVPMYDSKGKEARTYINHMTVCENGDVMIATSGYGLLRLKRGKKRECRPIGGALKKYEYIYTVKEDNLHRLLIITENNKLLILNPNGSLVTEVPGLKDVKAREVGVDSKGNIWLATMGQGLYLMPQGKGTFQRIDIIGNLPMWSIYISKNDNVYIGCDGMGIFMYNPITHQVIDNPFFSNAIDLSKSKVSSIIEDRQGNVWISMLQKGVFMQPGNTFSFGYMGYRLGNHNTIGSNCVTAVLYAKNGHVWVGTDKDGAYELDGSYRLIRHYTNVPLVVLSLCEDKKGRIWIGSYRNGCGYVEGSSYHKVNIGNNPELSFFDMECDANGTIWMASMGHGLFKYAQDGSVHSYTMKKGADNNQKINSLPNNFLSKLSVSHDGKTLFVATSIGLSALNIKTDSWLSTFGKNCINNGTFSHSVYADRKGKVWFGTDDGVYCYDFHNGINEKRYTIKEGICDNSICSITEDSKGRIWLGTAHGICCLNPRTGKTENYYAESGIQSNEFSDGTVASKNNGALIIMGGTGGITWFEPAKVAQQEWDAKVAITDFVVGSRSVFAGMESGIYEITDKRVIDSETFNLAHDDNSFTIHLSTLTFNNVEQITYAYRINGDHWYTTRQGANELVFNHLASGTYHFKVKAICNGQESPIKEFTVTIHPAWYASTWAKIIYLIVFIALIRFYFIYRKRKEEDRLLLQEHIHAEELSESKLRSFMNISHEIRTPMTLIVSPLQQLIKNDPDPQRQAIYTTIHRNAKRILHLINEIMDLRKIDKGQMAMHMKETDMVKYIKDVYTLFTQQAKSQHINLSFVHDTESLNVWFDPNNFDKVLVNIISNAFKYTSAGGNIRITLTHTDSEVKLVFFDDGESIPEDKIQHIFERFYQAPTESNDRKIGTGIGLDLTRSLVELHYGDISVHNNIDAPGCEFVVTLPLGNSHLKPAEMEEVEESTDELTYNEMNALADNIEQQIDITPEQLSEQLAHRTREKILIAEDDYEISQYLEQELSQDFDVIVCANGMDAFETALREIPSLIISDVMMPVMDGISLSSRLRNNINTNDVPIILLTGKSTDEDRLKGLETGADAYIVKPFNMEILHRTIINLIAKRTILRNKFTGNESQDHKLQGVTLDAPDSKLIDRVMDVINANISNTDLSVDMVANEVGISRVHLYRKMKELTNQTPHGFIRNIRLKQAAKLLSQPGQNITEVMYTCGFSNLASFSTMFKGLYGMSPREYASKKR